MDEPYCQICGADFALGDQSSTYPDLCTACAEELITKDEEDDENSD
jgi:hypothetical protein